MKKIHLSIGFAAFLLSFSVFAFANAELAPGPLVKCSESPDVYVVSAEYEDRLVLIMNEISFLSHGYSWDDIVNIPCDEIEQMSFSYRGYNAEKLLKFVGSPEVYEDRPDYSFIMSRTSIGLPGDVFYHIENEAVAVEMFGDDWERKIVEVPEALRETTSFK